MKDYITFLSFDDLSEDDLLKRYCEDVADNKKVITITPNLDGLRIAYKDIELRDNLNKADYSTIDGKPIIWVAKILKKKHFKHKISGSDLVPNVLKLANEKGWTVTIFGGKEGVADRAKEKIEKEYPNVKVAATICPEFGFEKDPNNSEKYAQMISSASANINLLCTGFPKTEKFFFENYNLFGPGLYFCVGATVDFIAGNVKRAPKWMSNCGLEWFYRLTQDFGRLFKRYWLDFWFLIKILFLIIFLRKWRD